MSSILLVEPDYMLAKLYGRHLEKLGHCVGYACTAQAAISAADKVKPDVVILELQLIEHSGIEFIYEFRSYSDWQNIPIIINSHIPPQEFKSSWKLFIKELGVSEYLYKPQASLERLASSIAELNLLPV